MGVGEGGCGRGVGCGGGGFSSIPLLTSVGDFVYPDIFPFNHSIPLHYHRKR